MCLDSLFTRHVTLFPVLTENNISLVKYCAVSYKQLYTTPSYIEGILI